jgi:hypothetical protein
MSLSTGSATASNNNCNVVSSSLMNNPFIVGSSSLEQQILNENFFSMYHHQQQQQSNLHNSYQQHTHSQNRNGDLSVSLASSPTFSSSITPASTPPGEQVTEEQANPKSNILYFN